MPDKTETTKFPERRIIRYRDALGYLWEKGKDGWDKLIEAKRKS